MWNVQIEELKLYFACLKHKGIVSNKYIVFNLCNLLMSVILQCYKLLHKDPYGSLSYSVLICSQEPWSVW